MVTKYYCRPSPIRTRRFHREPLQSRSNYPFECTDRAKSPIQRDIGATLSRSVPRCGLRACSLLPSRHTPKMLQLIYMLLLFTSAATTAGARYYDDNMEEDDNDGVAATLIGITILLCCCCWGGIGACIWCCVRSCNKRQRMEIATTTAANAIILPSTLSNTTHRDDNLPVAVTTLSNTTHDNLPVAVVVDSDALSPPPPYYCQESSVVSLPPPSSNPNYRPEDPVPMKDLQR